MIHSTAIIEEGAVVGNDIEVGPFCVIGKNVKLGDRVKLVSHVVIDGDTVIGDDTVIYPFASVGIKSQDLKFQEDDQMTGVRIGKRCKIREYVTIHQGTPASRGTVSTMHGHVALKQDSSTPLGTIIGNDCQVMVNAHIAHDCVLGNNVVLSNLVQLAGHVEVGDFAIISAGSAVHQFCTIGESAFLGALSATAVDIPPYVIYEGMPARYRTINKLGLTRRGFTPEDMQAVHLVYSEILNGDPSIELGVKISKLRKKLKDNQYAMNALDFIEKRSGRGITAGAKAAYQRD